MILNTRHPILAVVLLLLLGVSHEYRSTFSQHSLSLVQDTPALLFQTDVSQVQIQNTSADVHSCKDKAQLTQSQTILCQVCKVEQVHHVTLETWKSVKFSAHQRQVASKRKATLQTTLPMTQFWIGFNKDGLCFGADKVTGKHNMFALLNALGVYDYHNVKLNKVFNLQFEIQPLNAVFWANWDQGFQQAYFEIDASSTAPIHTTKNELKMFLRKVVIDSFSKSVKYAGTIDYPNQKGTQADKFELVMTQAQLLKSDVIELQVTPVGDTTVAQKVVALESQQFMDQLPSPKGISNINNMKVLSMVYSVESPSMSEPSVFKHAKLKIEQLPQVAVMPTLALKNVKFELNIVAHSGFHMKMEGSLEIGTTQYTGVLQYTDKSKNYDVVLTPVSSTSATLSVEDIEVNLLRIVAARDISAKMIPEAADKDTQKILDRLKPKNLKIERPKIEVDFNPHTHVVVRGRATVFKESDAQIEVIVANNQGKVEIITNFIFRTESLAVESLKQATALGETQALSNLRNNYEIGYVCFTVSRNDLQISSVKTISQAGSSVLQNDMVLNQGLNLSIHLDLPLSCSVSAVFCNFLRTSIDGRLNLVLWEAIRNGEANLMGKLGKVLKLEDNLVIKGPKLNLHLIAEKDLEMMLVGTLENFKLFDNGSKQTPEYNIVVKNFKNIELKVESKTAQIIYTDARRKVAFTQVQMLAVFPKGKKSFSQIKVSGLVLFGKNCFNMPPSTDMVASLTKSAIKGEFHPTLGVSADCYPAWVDFQDIKSYPVKGELAYTGIAQIDSFQLMINPFMRYNEIESDYKTFLNSKISPSIFKDLKFKEKWMTVQFHSQQGVQSYSFGGPVDFMGLEGVIKGKLFPSNQTLSAEISILPKTMLHNNVKIFNSEYDYFKSEEVKKSVIRINYSPGLQKSKQVEFDVELEVFQISQRARASVGASKVKFFFESAPIFHGFLNMTVNIEGDYQNELERIQFEAAGQLSDNHQRLLLQEAVTQQLNKLNSQAKAIITYIEAEKAKTIKLLIESQKAQCTATTCQKVNICGTKDDITPKLSCNKYHEDQVCQQKREVCPKAAEQCLSKNTLCSVYDPSSGICTADFYVCVNWRKSCSQGLMNICTDYQMKKDLSKCLRKSFDCNVSSVPEEDCVKNCEERKTHFQYLQDRLQLQISLQNRVDQLLLWRKYLDFTESVSTFAQVQSVQFKVPLHEQYIEGREISVNVELLLAFKKGKESFTVKTTADVLAQRELLTKTVAHSIVEQVAIQLDIEDLKVWRDMALVSELIKSALEEKDLLKAKSKTKIEISQGDKNEFDWILQKVKTQGVELPQLIKDLSVQRSKFNAAGVKRIPQNIIRRDPLSKLPPATTLTENAQTQEDVRQESHTSQRIVSQEQPDWKIPKDGLHSTSF